MKSTINFILFSFIIVIFISESSQANDYVCPYNHRKINLKSKIKCPDDAEVTGGKCHCKDTNKYFDVNEWKCKTCPTDAEKKTSGIDNYDYTCDCKIPDSADPENPYPFSDKVFDQKLGQCTQLPKNRPCSRWQFYDKNKKECVECPTITQNNQTLKTYSFENDDEQCDCGKDFFWNDDTLKCESCNIEGIYGLSKSSNSATDNKKCRCDSSFLIGSESALWNPIYKRCIFKPDRDGPHTDYAQNCANRNMVYDKNLNLCVECPAGSEFYRGPYSSEYEYISQYYGGKCACLSLYDYYDETTNECLPTKDKFGKHSRRKDYGIWNTASCLKGYAESPISNKCLKCPKHEIGNQCYCDDDTEFFNRTTFKCQKCPEYSHIDFSDNSKCICIEPFIMVNETCSRCPDQATYDKETKKCVCRDDYTYNERENTCEKVEEGDFVESYICLECPEGSKLVKNNDGEDSCDCGFPKYVYDKYNNTCKELVIEATSKGGFIKAGFLIIISLFGILF